jgi:hypothetical protein
MARIHTAIAPKTRLVYKRATAILNCERNRYVMGLGRWWQRFEEQAVGVSREQAAENRRAIVAAATQLFRERGVEAVGLNELMRHTRLYARRLLQPLWVEGRPGCRGACFGNG